MAIWENLRSIGSCNTDAFGPWRQPITPIRPFDETGQCVAGLIEHRNSPLASKMKAKSYPTTQWNGIVFIWMGETEPVPLEEDLPWELLNPKLSGRKYTRVKVWEANWTEPVNQGIDYHEFYLHRGLSP